jgi:hypothetical protein
MNAGGTLDMARRIAGHCQLSTTKIYDRSHDRLTLDEIERVDIGEREENAENGLKESDRLLT